ncbi:hypothetical protein Pelo_2291 [Pelomyxa schiedti]|nr:hypothetical protein Pelo_2291 [Pelomyxa schiedti]
MSEEQRTQHSDDDQDSTCACVSDEDDRLNDPDIMFGGPDAHPKHPHKLPAVPRCYEHKYQQDNPAAAVPNNSMSLKLGSDVLAQTLLKSHTMSPRKQLPTLPNIEFLSLPETTSPRTGSMLSPVRCHVNKNNQAPLTPPAKLQPLTLPRLDHNSPNDQQPLSPSQYNKSSPSKS